MDGKIVGQPWPDRAYCLNRMDMKQWFLIIFLAAGFESRAQLAENLSSRLAGFEYFEVVKGKDHGDLPLLIVFHYSGGTPQETIADYDSLKNPVRIILPRGNYQKKQGFSYFPVDYYDQEPSLQYKLARKTVDSLARFVKALEKRYKGKAIISGISQGGDIALLLARFYPELFRASFPFAAVIPDKLAPGIKTNRAGELPVYMFQGENDTIVPLAVTQKKLKDLGKRMDIQLATYPGLGHGISKEMQTDFSILIDQYTKPVSGKK